MTDWIILNREELRESSDPKSKSLTINIYASPYDIPEGVKSFMDDTKTYINIQFKYLNEEKTEPVTEDRLVSLEIGKQSRRLHKIIIDTREIVGGSCSIDIVSKIALAAIERMMNIRKSPITTNAISKDNYTIAKKIIETNENLLFANLQSS
jgi:hypothetical protein